MRLLFRILRRWGGIFLVGAASFAAAELLWLVVAGGGRADTWWILEPTQGIISCMTVLFMAALITAVRSHPTGFSVIWCIFIAIGSIFIMLLGVMFALTTLLVIIGEWKGGEIIVPVILVINFFFVAPPVAVGWAFGALIAGSR
jgi:hypothetical protein